MTLLEWLENNRGKLSNGVYGVFRSCCVSLNDSALYGNHVEYTTDKYKVENGVITLIDDSKITLLEWLVNHSKLLEKGKYMVDGRGVIFHGNKALHQKQSVFKTNEIYEFWDGNLYHLLGDDRQLVHSLNKSDIENKYNRKCKGVVIDVYDVIKAFDVTCPALQHLIKKSLCTGLRGHKSREQDLLEILASAKRAVELNNE